MLSNSDTPFVRQLYEGYRTVVMQARRAINSQAYGRGAVAELAILNY
jgi:DNA adenine methylase